MINKLSSDVESNGDLHTINMVSCQRNLVSNKYLTTKSEFKETEMSCIFRY